MFRVVISVEEGVLLKKVVYFDENSATDYLVVKNGGALVLNDFEEEKSGSSAEIHVGAKLKLLFNSLFVSGAAKVDSNIGLYTSGENLIKTTITNTTLATLLEKKSIANQRSAITQLLAGKKKVIREKKAIAEINTKKLSNLSRKAHDELLTKNLETLFGEIKSVDDILSEGEQKATALALFLAEIILSDNHSVLVFDDPVNSMDHRMMGSFAEKLLQIDNQVILFTHNRMFLESFGESSNGHFCKTYDTACNKNKGRHILLYETLSEGKNSKGVISRKQIDKAKDYIRGVEELLKESPFTKKQEACAKLRFAVELLIDEIVFNGQVPTKYSTKSSRINWEGLKSITSDSAVIDILKDVHGRCSGGELHNGMERNENPVEKADIQEMVNKLKEISH